MHCLFIFHKWRAVSVKHFVDTSYGQRTPSTTVTLQCERCGNLKKELLHGAGFVAIEDLNHERKRRKPGQLVRIK